ncbi:MAG TPA: hypothetical protein VFU74_21795 [Actinocrinis sp.]|nr:hypothetical protein [Actinocrinis sp.]
MSAVYTYTVAVVSHQNSRMTMHVKATTEAEALFQAGRAFDLIHYNVAGVYSRQEGQLCSTIMREGISHLDVTRTD